MLNANLRHLRMQSYARLRWGISLIPAHVPLAGSAAQRRRRPPSLTFPTSGPKIRLGRRLPVLRSNRPLPARAKSHGARSLAHQTRRIGLRGLCGICSAPHEIDAVPNTPRLLEIECARRSSHFGLKILDGFTHHSSMRECDFRRHCALNAAGWPWLPILRTEVRGKTAERVPEGRAVETERRGKIKCGTVFQRLHRSLHTLALKHVLDPSCAGPEGCRAA